MLLGGWQANEGSQAALVKLYSEFIQALQKETKMSVHLRKIRAEVPFGAGRMAVRKLDLLMRFEVAEVALFRRELRLDAFRMQVETSQERRNSFRARTRYRYNPPGTRPESWRNSVAAASFSEKKCTPRSAWSLMAFTCRG